MPAKLTRLEFGALLKAARIQKKLIQATTAEGAGIPLWAVAQAETGRAIGKDRLEKLCKFLDIPVPGKFAKDDPPEEKPKKAEPILITKVPEPSPVEALASPVEALAAKLPDTIYKKVTSPPKAPKQPVQLKITTKAGLLNHFAQVGTMGVFAKDLGQINAIDVVAALHEYAPGGFFKDFDTNASMVYYISKPELSLYDWWEAVRGYFGYLKKATQEPQSTPTCTEPHLVTSEPSTLGEALDRTLSTLNTVGKFKHACAQLIVSAAKAGEL